MTRVLRAAKRVLWASVLAVILFVAGMAYLAPETNTYTSNADVPTRPTTTHRFTPTTTTTTTQPAVTEAEDDLVVIDGARVYRLPRTQAVALYLWLAINQETTR